MLCPGIWFSMVESVRGSVKIQNIKINLCKLLLLRQCAFSLKLKFTEMKEVEKYFFSLY